MLLLPASFICQLTSCDRLDFLPSNRDEIISNLEVMGINLQPDQSFTQLVSILLYRKVFLRI
ncbi:MAG: hypothetical protein KME59_14240 [Trichormus sp. ATA11-4-KO1]|nr:hypothetical protein [Trichormus sp. ATA11-4-KO1]